MDLAERQDGQAARHPWEEARAKFIIEAMLNQVDPTQTHKVLDVGSGDAWLCDQISRHFPETTKFTAWDKYYSDEDLETLPRSPNVKLVRNIGSTKYDLLTLFDVLEHIEDDHGFLRNLVAHHLQPGGMVLITVPSFPSLYSAHDAALHHCRRYTQKELTRVIQGAGLSILNQGGLFHSLLLPRMGIKLKELLIPPKTTQSQHAQTINPLVRPLLSATLAVDTWFATQIVHLPVTLPGLSWWAICQRPSS